LEVVECVEVNRERLHLPCHPFEGGTTGTGRPRACSSDIRPVPLRCGLRPPGI